MVEIADFKSNKLHKWKIGASTFIVNISRGARLMSWFLEFADGTTRDIIYWPADADMDGGFPIVRGGNPILFPFCGRNHIDGKPKCWKTLDGKVLPMENHGYARQGRFEPVRVFEQGFSAKFIPDEECKKAYPYNYEFYVHYRFSEFLLACELELKNLDTVDIPWSAGNHFYFKLPWHENTSRKDYRILCDAKKAFGLDENGNLFERPATFPADFSDPDLFNRINCKLKTNIVKFGSKSGEEDITLRIGASPKPDAWNSVVTWSESPDAPYYCIEPWMSAPNTSSHRGGLSIVKPNSAQVFTSEISIF